MITGIILGGGKSIRLGEDKVTLRWGGGTLLDNQVNKLRSFCQELVLVTNQPQSVYRTAGLKVVFDEVPYQGPLGGIVAGLKASESPYNLVVAVDMPFVEKRIIELMVKEMEQFDVVVPESDRGLEPLQAIYSQDCIGPAEKHLKKGDRRIVSFFDEVKVKVIEKEGIKKLNKDFTSFFNINTREDYEKALSTREETEVS